MVGNRLAGSQNAISIATPLTVVKGSLIRRSVGRSTSRRLGLPSVMTMGESLVFSPEHPHYRGGVTPGILWRRARSCERGPSTSSTGWSPAADAAHPADHQAPPTPERRGTIKCECTPDRIRGWWRSRLDGTHHKTRRRVRAGGGGQRAGQPRTGATRRRLVPTPVPPRGGGRGRRLVPTPVPPRRGRCREIAPPVPGPPVYTC